MATRKKTDPTYTEASAELETILDDIETGTADIDVLSERVERAAGLIKFCREKLSGTEMRVHKIVQDLASTDAAATEADANSEE